MTCISQELFTTLQDWNNTRIHITSKDKPKHTLTKKERDVASFGLCHFVRYYSSGFYTSRELERQFEYDKLDADYPFHGGDAQRFLNAYDHDTSYLCRRRIQWVERKLREFQLEHEMS